MVDFGKILLPGKARQGACPIVPVGKAELDKVLARRSGRERAWAKANGFSADAGRSLTIPDARGGVATVLLGLGDASRRVDPFLPGKLSRELPPGTYVFAGKLPGGERLAALSWLLHAYAFERYRSNGKTPARLVVPDGVDRDDLLRVAGAIGMARDLINTPASDLGPEELEAATREIAKRHRAKLQVTSGARLEKRFPLIHTVGRASTRPPRLIDMRWGKALAPRVTLVGKGVCFDTGGLDIKPSSNMLLMKKDMGGGAAVLALADMVMGAGLPVRLRVLVAAVENSISGDAFRPGDVFRSRKGLTVEIGNTDAEGRLILADALALADEEEPELLLDLATLTGAARVALGPDLPAFYTEDEKLGADIARHGEAENDPVWRLPLWQPYETLFESRVADINNAGNSPFAGSITAALFLRRFVAKAKSYAHFDIFGWTPAAKPGRPMGGEAQVARALYGLLRERYPV